MGRIKTQFVKRLSQELMEEHGKGFKTEFKDNKELVSKFTDVSSKKIRNVIAGYVTRMVKMKAKK